MRSGSHLMKSLMLGGAMAFVLAAAPVAVGGAGDFVAKRAHAEEDGGGKGKMGQGAGQAGQKGKGASAIGGKGMGQGGPSADSDAKGPRAGQATPGSRGGKPVWAQEGIPEVELGRLSVARAPSHVLDKALAEALLNWTDAKTTLYSLPLDQFIAALATLEEGAKVDSPLENLALYKDLMADGELPLAVTFTNVLDLAAVFFGGAADKTITITTDTVKAINTILSVPALSEADLTYLATKADAVRQAILDAHG